MQNKKRIFLSFSIILFVGIFMLIICYIKRDQLAFNHYIKAFTQESLCENALDLHYTLKDPANYGIYTVSSLPVYQAGDALTSYAEHTKKLTTLKKIDSSALSQNDAFTYNVLQAYLEETMALEKYPYYAEPLTPNSGIHTTLPILLAEYTFYDKQDIENYFELLSAIPAYLEGITTYEREKAHAGLFMSSASLDKVIAACREFALCEEISSHLLATSFSERLDEFSASCEKLSSDETEQYLNKNQVLLESQVFPAYLTLAQNLTELSSLCNNNYTGLCSVENGKEYYLALLKRNTGSYRSIADIKEMLYASFEESYIQLIDLLSQNPKLLESDCLLALNEQFPLEDATLILNQLQDTIARDFPLLPASTSVDIKSISKNLEDYCSPAFYLTVPIDAYEKNVIYLNEKNALTGIDLYTTLAHEGFPGHLYQTVYFHISNSRNNASDTSVTNHSGLLRNLLYYGGYTEGYALYVESLSYDWAAALCEDADMTDAKVCCDTLKYEWQMQISLYCLLDIAIHYDGASYEQVAALLNKFGIVDEASQKAVYQYLLEEPTTYLKYYLGYLEILNLKNLAKNLWQDNYTDLRFHTFLLDAGPCNYQCLTQKIMEE